MSRPRILFIGFAESSHATSWMELLRGGEFDVRLFALPSGAPPRDFPFFTYVTMPGWDGADSTMARKVYPSENRGFLRTRSVANALNEAAGGRGDPLSRGMAGASGRFLSYLDAHWPSSLEGALAKVIKEWQPQIIHTLGFDDAAYLYLRAREAHGLHGIGRWVAQARGSDIIFFAHLPEWLRRIEAVLRSCDRFICDNAQSYEFALAHGLDPARSARDDVGVVSGPGGLAVDELAATWTEPPSRRERVILWPKCYETMYAKAGPVFEALKLAWSDIQPCRVQCLWLVQDEVRVYFQKLLPPEIREACQVHQRLPRERVLEMTARARVMLAPSLVDGIPNVLMEAMALGAFPIVSPLDTITPVVRDPANVLFARNLHPAEIAEALVRAMNQDELVDGAARANLKLVSALADRSGVSKRVLAFYRRMAGTAPGP